MGTTKILAAFIALIGVIWFFQGINVLPGSFMTGDIRWAFAGIAFCGLAVYLWRRK